MNIFVPLIIGVIVGYFMKDKLKRFDLDKPMSVTLLLLIFFMGVEAGRVEINALNLLIASLTFAVLTIVGSLFFAVLLGGRLR
ncbi:DUF340 domain-containing protein [Thermococcus sp. M39]|uniref:LysO family transporter n=1 Tax=unclassified Thermococcus TaxID=2627626 RepID=UPI001439D732|nr:MULTISPECIES: LysO family transporter [unclassified Thermococcus]NJE07437.1 DUF340 domain-containing protein [Thermococcus sp. M39]NJE12431.1 DUF340 domain-containing protein [Thermococcus sp. LS2]